MRVHEVWLELVECTLCLIRSSFVYCRVPPSRRHGQGLDREPERGWQQRPARGSTPPKGHGRVGKQERESEFRYVMFWIVPFAGMRQCCVGLVCSPALRIRRVSIWKSQGFIGRDFALAN